MEFVGYLLNSISKSAQIGWGLLKPVIKDAYESFTDKTNANQSGGKRHSKTRRRKKRRKRRKHTRKTTH
jgi:hypothetical protein